MTCHEANGAVVLTPQGHLREGEESDHLEADLARILDHRASPRIIVDLAQTGHLSARAVGIIADAHLKACQRGGRLTISRMAREHQRLFEITGLAQVIELVPKPARADVEAPNRAADDDPRPDPANITGSSVSLR